VIAVEAFKQARRGRTALSLLILAGIPVLMGGALLLAGGPEGGGDGFVSRVTSNGLFLPIAAVAATSRLFLVVVAALFVGEGVASESAWGTERYVLVRPVSRRRYLVAKVVVGHALVTVAVGVVAAAGLVVGAVLFGIEPIAMFGIDLSVGQTLARLAVTVAYVSFDLLVVGAIGLLVAVITESSAAALVGAVGVGITSQILDAITALGAVRRFLPTHYWGAWIDLFRIGTPLEEMRNGVVLGFGYSVAVLLIAFWIYETKDINS
jgi:ABC-2 type transport system permease protein